MTKSKSRPSGFRLGTFDWSIKYHSSPSDLHGETRKDTRQIDVFTGGYSEQVIKDTLLHECLHVVFEDIPETVLKMDAKPDEIEEQIIRLLTPRIHSLFTDNKSLREYIFNGKLTKGKK